jgi:hypothetical protein
MVRAFEAGARDRMFWAPRTAYGPDQGFLKRYEYFSHCLAAIKIILEIKFLLPVVFDIFFLQISFGIINAYFMLF